MHRGFKRSIEKVCLRKAEQIIKNYSDNGGYIMKNYRKITAAFLALSLTAVMTGCGNSASASKHKADAKGSYLEEKIEMDASVGLMSEIVKDESGFSFYDLSTLKKYSLRNDENNLAEVNDAVSDAVSTIEDIIGISTSPSGECLVTYFDLNTGGYAYKFVDKNGEIHPIKSEQMLINAEFSEDGRLFASALGCICEINTSSYSTKELLTTGVESVGFDIIGDRIISIDDEGTHIYNYKENKEESVPDVLNKFFSDRKSNEYSGDVEFDLCGGEDDSMYIVAKDGVFRYVMNGNQIEQIINGASSSIGDPSYHPNSIILGNDGSIYVGFMEGMMTRYTFDGEFTEKASRTLKVYSLESNDTLASAINAFASANKDVKIDQQIGMKNGSTYEDAMKNLTTQILSGEAPDVILVDGIDINNFIDKNMLMDLSAYEDIWNPDKDILDNIAKWNSNGSKLYSVACKFRIPAIAADKSVIGNIKSYSDIAAQVEKVRNDNKDVLTVVCLNSPEAAINNALIYTGSEVFSGSGIDKEKLEKMFEDCAKLYTNDHADGVGVSTSFGSDGLADEYNFASKLANAVVDSSAMAVGTLNTFDCDLNLATSTENYDKTTNVEVRYGLTENSKLFIPTCNLGVVESGKNKDDAIKFIQTALGTAQQKIDNTDGFPVNKDALDYFYNKNAEGGNDTSLGVVSSDGNISGVINVEWIDKDEAKTFDNYINTLSEPLVIDDSVKEIIIEAGKKCIEGKSSASEAAEQVLRQLDIKMKE